MGRLIFNKVLALICTFIVFGFTISSEALFFFAILSIMFHLDCIYEKMIERK